MAKVMESLDLLLPALLDSLNAPSEKVVVESLTVQASIAEDEDRFRHLMDLLLDRCSSCWIFEKACINLACALTNNQAGQPSDAME